MGHMIINGNRVEFTDEKNVLTVIRNAGIDIPTLCYHPDVAAYGSCRLCTVEDDRGKTFASCAEVPKDGMVVYTNTERLMHYRQMIIELLLASHDRDCTTCSVNVDCHLQDLAHQFGVRQVRFSDSRERAEIDRSSPAVVRDPNKCILCGDCVRVCEEMQGMNIIDFVHRGSQMRVAPAFNRMLSETNCISCGQCAAVCPVGAITVKNEIGEAWRAIHDPKLRTVVQIAPAVRVAVGEAFGLPAGDNVLHRLVTALKLMGVDEVYDTTFGADFTTISEAEEFKERLKVGGPFPMFTSCCPAWVKYLEKENPSYLHNISTCKSPMEMFAAILRDKYAAKDAEDGKRTYHIAIMPCTAKKMEAARDEFKQNGQPDVDLVLTTREIVDMIRESGIRLEELDLEAPDLPFGMGSGSANIYGVTGGVAEAVVRHCVPDKSKNALREIAELGLRGDEARKEVTVHLGDQELKLAVVHGLANARKLLKEMDEGKAFFHLVEVMTCQGGCVGGAGQPDGLRAVKIKRGEGLHAIDDSSLVKRAERNPVVATLLNEMGEHKAHELLHVSYVKE